MKKILIVSHAMELGGAERALLGLLHALDKKNCKVDLFLMRHTGPLMRQIPEGVNLLPENPRYAALLLPMKTALKRRQFGVVFGRLRGKQAASRYCKRNKLPAENSVGLEYSHKYTLPYLPVISEKQYDLAISFLTPHYIVANKTNADHKAAWIHTDYSQLVINRDSELKMWSQYGTVVSISESVSEAFTKAFPTLADRLMIIENISVPAWIQKDADAFTVEEEMPQDGSTRLLSVGRFCRAKNFDNVPDICRKIRAQGIDAKWYLIGFGSDEALIRQRIAEAGMEQYVIILGRKENPYPYMKACDLYVQPSRFEGNAVTVHEAQILGKPVVITDYPTANSQLRDGVDGVIVPVENQDCANGIARLLRDSAFQAGIANNARNSYSVLHTSCEQMDRLLK